MQTLRSLLLGAIAFVGVAAIAQAQTPADESAAQIGETTTLPEKTEATAPNALAPARKQAEAKVVAKQARAQKFVQSRVGQWLVKRAIHKAEKRAERLQKAGKLQAAAKIKREAGEAETKGLSGNLRTALILAILAVIAFVLAGISSVFALIGTILLVAALVFVLLEFI